MKKYLAMFLLFVLSISLFACSESTNSNTNNSTADTSTGEVDSTMFASGDTKEIDSSDYDENINLSNLSADYTISAAGTYHVTGSTSEYQLIVDYEDSNEKNVHLVLDNVTMSNSKKAACIYVKNAEKVVIHLVGTNAITATGNSYTDGSSTIDGAIHAKDDLTITGTGTLTVKSNNHGIVCKNDLKITGGTVTVEATKKAVDANDSYRQKDGTVTLTSTSADGIHVENDDNDAFFYMEGGTLTITAFLDAVDVSSSTSKTFNGYLSFVGGALEVVSGSGYSKSNDTSKGLKSDGTLVFSGGSLTVSASDDALHSSTNVNITGGVLDIKSGDDGIHADNAVNISGGTITAYGHEGVEGNYLNISGGITTVTASDDGINASKAIVVSGGYLDITMGSGDVDGVDSNGTYTQTGGFVISRISTNGGGMAAALDTDSTITFTGGTFIAVGTYAESTIKYGIPYISFGSTSSMMGPGGRGGRQSSSSSTSSISLSKGTYYVDGVDIEFSVSTSYSALVIVSDLFTSGTSYTIKNSSGSSVGSATATK